MPEGRTTTRRPRTTVTHRGTRTSGGTAGRRGLRPARRNVGDRHLGRPATGVVVTGGASGIGRAVCLALAEVGRPVAAWDLDAAGARRTARRCTDDHGVPAIGLGVDVTVTGALGAAVKRSLGALGSIGGLVHAAGIGGPGMVTDLTDESWDAVLDVNLRSAAMLTKVLHPALCQASPGSAVVYISSIEGFFGNTYLAAYSASKAGVLGLARSAAHTLGPNAIRVNAVCPGAVDTPLLAPLLDIPGVRETLEARIPLGRVAQPEDIGRTVRFLLSDDAGYITGASLIVDGGLTAVAGI